MWPRLQWAIIKQKYEISTKFRKVTTDILHKLKYDFYHFLCMITDYEMTKKY